MERVIEESFERWLSGREVASGLEGLLQAFKGGWYALEKSGLVIYGAMNRQEFELLMDDLGYWVAGLDIPTDRLSLSVENFCRAYVLLNVFATRKRFLRGKRAVRLRLKDRIEKKYSRKRLYLWGSLYFRFLCKRFGVLERKKARLALIELAARNKWWPLCAWDIALKRDASYRPSRARRIDRIAERLPEKWKEEMEKVVLAYWKLKAEKEG